MTTLKKSKSISTQNNIQMRSDERQIFFGVVIALYFLPTGQGNTIFLRDLLATNLAEKRFINIIEKTVSFNEVLLF